MFYMFYDLSQKPTFCTREILWPILEMYIICQMFHFPKYGHMHVVSFLKSLDGLYIYIYTHCSDGLMLDMYECCSVDT